jgi:hypothetical protein
MSKQSKIEEIKEVIRSKQKPGTLMQIFIQAKPTDERRYFNQVPWAIDVNVNCPDEAAANKLKEFLLADRALQT